MTAFLGNPLKLLLGVAIFVGIISSSHAGTITFADIVASVRPDNIANYAQFLSSIPHLAGTPADVQQASWVYSEWQKLGMDQVKVYTYDVLLSYPTKDKPNKVSVFDGQGTKLYETLGIQPPLIKEDVSSDTLPNYLAYTPGGTVESTCLVYAFYGRIKDFQLLDSLGIKMSGCMVLARLGSSFRGNIILNAQERGAVGVILYSDPADVAPLGNKQVYPAGPYYPQFAAQKGTTNPFPGDALTPGIPAKPYAFRTNLTDTALPRIIAQPIGYFEALQLFKIISGSTPLPSGWQGGLNITYKLGPQLVRPGMKIRIVSNNNYAIRTIYNVVGMIRGCVEPDRWVMVGNHRDAWDFGGADPSTGMASVMEMARTFATLRKTRGCPRRTLVFTSWDAEEFGIVGSMEYVEEFLKVLKQKAVVYLSDDQGCGMNFVLYSTFTPSMRPVLQEVAGLVRNPNAQEYAAGRKTILDTMLLLNPDPSNNKAIAIPFFGSFSDYHGFQFVAGISSLYLVYLSKDFDNHFLYHSLYDSFYMVRNFSDPGFVCNTALTQVHAALALKFADSTILPFDLAEYGNYIDANVKALDAKYGNWMLSNRVTLSYFKNSAANLKAVTAAFMNIIKTNQFTTAEAQRNVNDKLMYFERHFIMDDGPAYGKHSVMSVNPRNLYGGGTFASLTDLLSAIGTKTRQQDPDNWNKLQRQLSVITNQFDQAAASLSDNV